MGSVPDPRRARLSTLTAGALVAALALGATAAAGLPHHDDASFTAAEPAPALGEPQPGDGFLDLVDTTELLGDDGPAPVADKPVPVVQATRSAPRAAVHPAIPKATAKDAACLLDLGYGHWRIDTTAARALTMYTAVAYKYGMKITKPARSFQRHIHTEGRTAPTPVEAEESLRKQYKGKAPMPRQLYRDAVLAMYRPHALTCTTPPREMPWQPMLTNGLTFRSQDLLFGWWDAYGGRPVGGFSPEGITTGHIENSAHYDGRAVDISFAMSDKANKLRGWLLAQWLVAHADYYQVQTIIWDGMIWSNYRGTEGWRKYEHPWGPTMSPTQNHLDHIHVDVVKGWSEDMPVDEDDKADAADAAEGGTSKSDVAKSDAPKSDKQAKDDKAHRAPKADPRVGGAD